MWLSSPPMLFSFCQDRSIALTVIRRSLFLVFFLLAMASTKSQDLLLFLSCSLMLSCILLLLIKAYVEVHMEIRGGTPFPTWKYTFTYVEVHFSLHGGTPIN